jgi:hypothetical protein
MLPSKYSAHAIFQHHFQLKVCMFPALPGDWKRLPGADTLAYWVHLYVTKKKSFVNTAPDLKKREKKKEEKTFLSIGQISEN